MKCPNCGEDVKPTDKQCPNCHFDLEKFRNEFFTGQDTTRNEKNDDQCRRQGIALPPLDGSDAPV